MFRLTLIVSLVNYNMNKKDTEQIIEVNKIKVMFKTVIQVLIIYLFIHISKVCFDSADLLDEQTIKNMTYISISIVIYYLFFDNLLERFI